MGSADTTLVSAGTLLAEGGPSTVELPADELPGGGVDEDYLPEGTAVGRYRVEAPIGAGGMGVVYRAYDPELDRQLAIKILRESRRARRDEARFLREAQAMARLSHPNVVPVHDVGSAPVGLFLAMELIDGQTLRGWLEVEARSWREIVDLFLAAGRGLAEAHAAGIVHRDFKPENVLVDRRGRPRVTDFGLARPESAEAGARPAADIDLGASPLTRSGTIMGTPAYMAPEQLSGRKVDARADVFAFCVALYEALFGSPPYGGATLGERLAVIVDGKLQEAPRRGVPRSIVRAISRGLVADPEARWPSMAALLDALERGLARRRSAWAIGLGAPALLLVGALGVRGGDVRSCAAAGALDGVWDGARGAAIGADFAASELPFAAPSWERAEAELGRYAGAWIDLREGSCRAHRRGEISAELLDRRALCLDQRRADLAAVVDALALADAKTIERAVDLVVGLEPIASCRDPAAADTGRSAADRAWAEDVRVRLRQIGILEETGKHEEALARVDALLREIEAIGDDGLRLETILYRGRIRGRRGELEEAERDLVAVVEGAYAGGFDRLTAQAAGELVLVSGEGLAHFAAGEAWARIALAGAARIGDDGRLEANARQWYGAMLSSADRVDEALVQLERAHAIRSELLGPEHRDTSGTASSLGNVLWKAGRLEASIATHEASLASREALLGRDHPGLVSALGNLGVALSSVGRLDEAREVWTRAHDLVVRSYSPEHPNAAVLAANLGGLASRAGDYAGAAEHLEEAVRVARVAFGEHPDTALILQNLGNLRRRAGDLEGADAALGEALRMTEATVGRDHSNIAVIELSLVRLRRDQGRAEEAAALVQAALENTQSALGPAHARVADALLVRAQLARERGELRPALADLERAREIVEEGETGPSERGATLFELGRVLALLGEREVEAEGLIARAEALAESAGGDGRELRAEIDAWREGQVASE
ncbi:MAG: serine/threonine-protein kinase [Nannocystaceae bacterium]